jgi:hypothetical protein
MPAAPPAPSAGVRCASRMGAVSVAPAARRLVSPPSSIEVCTVALHRRVSGRPPVHPRAERQLSSGGVAFGGAKPPSWHGDAARCCAPLLLAWSRLFWRRFPLWLRLAWGRRRSRRFRLRFGPRGSTRGLLMGSQGLALGRLSGRFNGARALPSTALPGPRRLARLGDVGGRGLAHARSEPARAASMLRRFSSYSPGMAFRRGRSTAAMAPTSRRRSSASSARPASLVTALQVPGPSAGCAPRRAARP